MQASHHPLQPERPRPFRSVGLRRSPFGQTRGLRVSDRGGSALDRAAACYAVIADLKASGQPRQLGTKSLIDLCTSQPHRNHGARVAPAVSPLGGKVSGAGSTCWPGTSRGFPNSNPKTERAAGRASSLSSWSNEARVQEPCGHRGKPRWHAHERWRR